MDSFILDTSLSRWIAVTGILLAALLVWRVVKALLKAASRRLNSPVLLTIVEQVEAPASTLLMTVGIRAALALVDLAPEAEPWIELGFKFLIVLTLTWLVVQIYEALHVAVLLPSARNSEAAGLHVFTVLRTLVRVLIWIAGIATGLHSVGLEVSAVLAALGIGGVALALASQDTVANLFGGFIVLFQRPFKVGELIEVAGIVGWVENIGLRTTTIRSLLGREVLIPNKRFTDSVVTNIDSQRGYPQDIRIRIDLGTPPDRVARALQILNEIVDELEVLSKSRYASLTKVDLGSIELELKFEVRLWSARDQPQFRDPYAKELAGKSQVLIEVLRRFAAESIQVAAPIEAHISRTV